MRIDQGSTEQRPSNTKTGSYDSTGLERKDVVRRLMQVWEPGHLMRLLCSHLTRQSREA